MSLIVVGTSHHTAPVEVRERLAFLPSEADATLLGLLDDGVAAEAVLLSTCNRTELYLWSADADAGSAAVATSLLAARAGLTADAASRHLYQHRREQAVRHLMRVVTSLDSMVLGEAQIQGQVRSAYEKAAALGRERRVVGTALARLFQTALSIGGRVRAETALGTGAASVPSAAVELARKIFGRLEGRRALVLGAGDMAELAVACFSAESMRSITIASRTEATARALGARMGANAIPFSEVAKALHEVDIVAAATSAPHVVLTAEQIARAAEARGSRPLLIVDIAIPRDVEQAAGDLANVFLYGIDDLRQIVDENLAQRQAAIPAVEAIIEEGVRDFWAWHLARDVVPLIRELRRSAEEVRQAEVARLFRKLGHLGPEDREAVEALTRQLLNKMLHGPTVRLREAAANGHAVEVIEAARYLFGADDEPAG